MDTNCEPCPANYFCPNQIKLPCPSQTTSPPGSSTFLNCTCAPGTTGYTISATSANCTACPEGQFCPQSTQTCGCE